MATFKDLQDMSVLLKNVYLPIRKKAFPLLTPALAAAKRGSPDRVRYAGNDLFFTVKLGRRGGIVSSGLGYLPEGKMAEERQGRLGIARTYARISVDGLAARATEDPKGAYISLAKKLVEDLLEEWQLTQERVILGDGLGVYAIVKTVTNTTTIVVDRPYGITGAGPGSLHLTVGDIVSIRSSDGVTHRGKAEITAISLSGDDATLTLKTAITGMVAGDLVCVGVPASTHSTDDSFGAEPYGFKAFVDAENQFVTFEGIRHPRWVAQKLTSTTVDEMVLLKLLNTIRARAGIDWRSDPKALLLITTTGIWESYGNSLLGLRRFDAPVMTLNGGFKAVQVAGAALIDDPWAPRGRIYAIHTPDTIFVDLMDFGKLSYEDAPVWTRSANRDAFESVYATYWNYGVTRRSSMGVIAGITDNTNYSPEF